MTICETNTKKVRDAFNNINIVKGQYISIATADDHGIPSVAPIGSMRMVDAGSVHVSQGMLPKTMANLKKNPKATFSVCHAPAMRDVFNMLKSNRDDTMGYRVYCTYTGTVKEASALAIELAAIKKRVPFFMRRAFEKFFRKTIKQVLTFEIDDIRPIQ